YASAFGVRRNERSWLKGSPALQHCRFVALHRRQVQVSRVNDPSVATLWNIEAMTDLHLVQCRTCSGNVAQAAASCPHCGEKEPAKSRAQVEFELAAADKERLNTLSEFPLERGGFASSPFGSLVIASCVVGFVVLVAFSFFPSMSNVTGWHIASVL